MPFFISLSIAFSASVAWSFESVTAAKAYELVENNEAFLLDIRSLEECYWVGSPSLEPNGMPIAFNIPWKLWPNNRITSVDDYFGPDMVLANELFGIILNTYVTDKSTKLILMCRSGHRTSDAAEYLENLGFTNVCSVDNYLKVAEDIAGGSSKIGGKGGFQGSSSNSPSDYLGYRGWPGRVDYLPIYPNHDPDWLPEDSSQSVSWMDTGLPVTQKMDANKIVYHLLGLVYQK